MRMKRHDEWRPALLWAPPEIHDFDLRNARGLFGNWRSLGGATVDPATAPAMSVAIHATMDVMRPVERARDRLTARQAPSSAA